MIGPSQSNHGDPWQAYPVKVDRVTAETPGVATYEMVFTDSQIANAFRFLPGQFNMLYVPGVGEAAISISSDASSPDRLRHTIRSVGGVTQSIAAGGRGMHLGLRGPFGSSWPIEACLGAEADRKDVILVAGGIGLAPLRSVIYALTRHRHAVGTISLLVGARSPTDLLYSDEYSVWTGLGVDVRSTVDRASNNWQGHIGVVTALLDRLPLPRPESTILMTCGPEVMMRYVAQSALQRGIPRSHLWLSLERHMNCAIGLCGHCQLGPEFICKDGPVLPFNRVAQWLKVQGL